MPQQLEVCWNMFNKITGYQIPQNPPPVRPQNPQMFPVFDEGSEQQVRPKRKQKMIVRHWAKRSARSIWRCMTWDDVVLCCSMSETPGGSPTFQWFRPLNLEGGFFSQRNWPGKLRKIERAGTCAEMILNVVPTGEIFIFFLPFDKVAKELPASVFTNQLVIIKQHNWQRFASFFLKSLGFYNYHQV